MANKRLFVGFSTQNLSGRDWTLYDIDLIKQDLLNHFYTRRGERLMLPTYGTIIWDMLFEPFTDSVRNAIIADVKRVISREPRVTLIDLKVANEEQGIIIAVDLKYSPWDVVDSFNVNFDRRTQEGSL